MTYKLEFVPAALKEWEKLGQTLKQQLKKKLAQCLENPHIPKNKLKGGANLYKIKLRTSGYRLVYEVDDHKIVVLVLAVGKRDRLSVYESALARK